MLRNNSDQSLKRTLVWFATFAVAYLATMLIAGSIIGDSARTSFIGSAIGILVALVIVVWWRHIRERPARDDS
jgi:preprotein translocase subunit SecF